MAKETVPESCCKKYNDLLPLIQEPGTIANTEPWGPCGGNSWGDTLQKLVRDPPIELAQTHSITKKCANSFIYMRMKLIECKKKDRFWLFWCSNFQADLQAPLRPCPAGFRRQWTGGPADPPSATEKITHVGHIWKLKACRANFKGEDSNKLKCYRLSHSFNNEFGTKGPENSVRYAPDVVQPLWSKTGQAEYLWETAIVLTMPTNCVRGKTEDVNWKLQKLKWGLAFSSPNLIS